MITAITDSQAAESEREYRKLSGLLAGLVTLASVLLFLALIWSSLAARQLVAARQCALLSSDGFWIYSVTQPAPLVPVSFPAPTEYSPPAMILVRPTDQTIPNPLANPPSHELQPSGDWQALFQGMTRRHDDLRRHYPGELRGTDVSWKGYALSLQQTRRVSWQGATVFESSFRAAANALQAHAAARANQALALAEAGVTILLGLFVSASALLIRRRRAALRMTAEKGRLETLLEATGQGVFQVDENGICTYINPTGADLLGYLPKELWGKEMEHLLYHPSEDNAQATVEYPEGRNPIRKALSSGVAAREDDDLLWRRDGTSFPASTLASPIRAEHGLVVTFFDISDRKQVEALRDDLTGMIVHDLRTPLTSLLSGLQTLNLLQKREADEQEILDIALEGGTTLLAMVNDLLDISKLESGSLALQKRLLYAPDLIEYALTQTASLARANGLRVARNIPPDLPAVQADEDKLRRALVNLLGNAVKFTPRGGIVTISASFDAAEQAIVFAVGDTGEGIPAHALKRIFEKFGQVESRKAGRKMSTGLGLTFCKLVAEAHGGHIWAESKLGKGSRFLFTIPAHPPAIG